MKEPTLRQKIDALRKANPKLTDDEARTLLGAPKYDVADIFKGPLDAISSMFEKK